jgi:hypothetical protein
LEEPCTTDEQLEPNSDDDGYAMVVLPFQFPFYSARYDTLYVCTDGSVVFNLDFISVRSFANLRTTRCITHTAPTSSSLTATACGARWGRPTCACTGLSLAL